MACAPDPGSPAVRQDACASAGKCLGPVRPNRKLRCPRQPRSGRARAAHLEGPRVFWKPGRSPVVADKNRYRPGLLPALDGARVAGEVGACFRHHDGAWRTRSRNFPNSSPMPGRLQHRGDRRAVQNSPDREPLHGNTCPARGLRWGSGAPVFVTGVLIGERQARSLASHDPAC